LDALANAFLLRLDLTTQLGPLNANIKKVNDWWIAEAKAILKGKWQKCDSSQKKSLLYGLRSPMLQWSKDVKEAIELLKKIKTK